MGRRVVTSVYLDEDLTEEARLIAEKLGYSLSKLVEEMLEEAVIAYHASVELNENKKHRKARVLASAASTVSRILKLRP